MQEPIDCKIPKGGSNKDKEGKKHLNVKVASKLVTGLLKPQFPLRRSPAVSACKFLGISSHQVSIASWTMSGRSPVWSITRARPNSGSISNTPGAQFAQFLHPDAMDECNISISQGPTSFNFHLLTLISSRPRAPIKQLSGTSTVGADDHQEHKQGDQANLFLTTSLHD
jgi:hypothetical protein